MARCMLWRILKNLVVHDALLESSPLCHIAERIRPNNSESINISVSDIDSPHFNSGQLFQENLALMPEIGRGKENVSGSRLRAVACEFLQIFREFPVVVRMHYREALGSNSVRHQAHDVSTALGAYI